MAILVAIADADDPRLEPFRDLRERDLVGRTGRFVAEGEVVIRLAAAEPRISLECVVLSPARARGMADLIALLPDTAAVYEAPPGVLDTVAGFPVHRGALAIGRAPQNPGADALLRGADDPALILVAIGIANHDNMGGLFRNAAAFGVTAVLLDATCCDPLYRKAIRVSTGAALKVPFARGEDAGTLIDAVERAGFQPFGLSPGGRTTLSALRPPTMAALVVGAEGPGLPRAILDRVTTLAIPMAAGFDSLNVATAAGIALHHFASAGSAGGPTLVLGRAPD